MTTSTPVIHAPEEMLSLLESWVNINSGSENLDGLAQMASALKRAFSRLGTEIHEKSLSPRKKINSKGEIVEISHGKALHLTKHPKAPIQIFLGGHMDTVYGPTDSFQKAEKIEGNKLRGPGAADMKGGLMVMLKALEALEKSPYAGKIGWEVLINPDEEVGSSGSEHLLLESAKRNHLGLIFEPAFANGAIVNERKGSVNFTIVAHGKAAHAGRDFQEGRNAIILLSRCIMGIDALSNSFKGITVNVGSIEGGGPVNIVPDLAICRVNLRVTRPNDLEIMKEAFKEIVNGSVSPRDIGINVYEHTSRPPKPFDKKTQALYEAIKTIDPTLTWQASGGVCDGNILAAAGLPTIDSLGVIGGNLHTADEYMLIDSLAERATLVAQFLIKLASSAIKIEGIL